MNPSPTFREEAESLKKDGWSNFGKRHLTPEEEDYNKAIDRLLSFFDSEWARRDKKLREDIERLKNSGIWDAVQSSEGAFTPSEVELAEEEGWQNALKQVLKLLSPSKDDLSKEI